MENLNKSTRALEVVSLIAFLAVIAGIPLFQAGHEVLVDKEAPYLADFFASKPTKSHLHGWDQAARDRSILSKRIRPLVQQLQFDVMGYAGPKAIVSKADANWLFYTPDVQYLLQAPWNDERFLHGSLDTLVAGKQVNIRDPFPAILNFRDQLRARGIHLLMVPVPGKPSVYPDKIMASIQADSKSPTESLVEEMRRQGLDAVDLFTPFREARRLGGPDLYLRTDTHWTPEGMVLAASIIAERVRQYPWFTREKSPHASDSAYSMNPSDTMVSGDGPDALYSTRTVATERWGDIAEMTKLPRRKNIWPSQRVLAQQVIEAQSGKPYSDRDSSDILFLGDSFARIYQTDDPLSAGIVSHLARLLNQPLASLVNDGGASSLVRKQLYRKARLLSGKKLVIWEFVERDIRFGKDGWEILALPNSPEPSLRK